MFYPLLYIPAKSSVLHPAALRPTSHTHHQDPALASGHVRASEVPAEHQCHQMGGGKPYHLVEFDKTPKLAKEDKLLKPKDEKQGSTNGDSDGNTSNFVFPDNRDSMEESISSNQITVSNHIHSEETYQWKRGKHTVNCVVFC